MTHWINDENIFFSQERIDHGELVRWTKGINVANTEGRDVAAMFATSLQKYVRNLSILIFRSKCQIFRIFQLKWLL